MKKHLLILAALLLVVLLPMTRAAEPSRIVFMIGEDEYHTWETLPDFAEKDLKPLGYRVTIVNADATNRNNFPGLVAALRDADLLFLSVRRRTLPKDQLDAVRAHLAAGKPLVGIRTASHAFSPLRDQPIDPKLVAWLGFDPEVLGGHYSDHYDNAPVTITLASGAETHSILKGVSVNKLIGHGGLYKNTPLEKTATPLLLGTILGHPPEPIAWTHRYGQKQARVFYTSLGHWDDFANRSFRILLVNGVVWALNK